jgi:hypothetical protein
MSLHTLSEQTNRYSVEVNYRTTLREVEDGFAQLVLGYISAAAKKANYHVKMVMDEKPFRVIVSTRNFQEGEWLYLVSWNEQKKCFVLSKGFYNKLTKNVITQAHKDCVGMSAAEVYSELMNAMHTVKDQKPHHLELNPVKGKRGPEMGSMRPAQGLLNASRPENID